MVGEVGVDAETVWAGIPTTCGPKIELPVLLARDEYPIPSDRMDVLTGLAIHEALHIREDSQRASGYLLQMFPKMANKTCLMRLAQTGEDIHVDGVAIKGGLFGKYVQASRSWWRRNYSKDYTIGLPNPEGLFGVWMDIVLDGVFPVLPADKIDSVRRSLQDKQVGDDPSSIMEILCCGDLESLFFVHRIMVAMPQVYLEPLELLLLNTPEIIDMEAEHRSICYRELWSSLERTLTEWLADIEKIESSEEHAGMDISAQEFGAEDELPPELSEAVTIALGQEAEDITDRIEASLKALGGEHEKHRLFATFFEDSTDTCKAAPHRRLVYRLREMFRLQQEAGARINHGLRSGRLDSRRLYRLPTTGLVFKQKEYLPENNRWGITLLLDASGSVMVHWNLIESVYAALVEALKGGPHRVEVLAYREARELCLMTRLCYGNSLFTVTPGGSTPSGEAVMAAALLMPPGDKKFMIHVTDGLWNTGVDVWYALELCKKEGIDLVTLGCGEATRALELQYGKGFQVLDSIEHLPSALESLLRSKLLPKG